jgi:uncharacterized repeat protein (TIGR03803 family)
MTPPRYFAAILVPLTVLLSLAGVSPAQAVHVLYSFNGALGANPSEIALTQGRDGELYGTVTSGGVYGQGSIFKITTAGTITELHSFEGTDGTFAWAGLTLGADGNFYSTTGEGGTGSWGVLFKMTPEGTVTVLHNFTQNGTDGVFPLSPPILASDGNFYGTTSYGGINGAGTVYKLTPAGVYTIIYNLDSVDGYSAQSSPTLGANGNLYIATLLGGSNQCGALLEISTGGVLSNAYSFECGATGGYPQGSLLKGADGNFYGTADNGGAYSQGVLFKLTPNFDYSVLYSFGATTTDGAEPNGGLIQATNGNLYGVDYYGGSFNDGTIYDYSSAGESSTLYSWNRENDAEGQFIQHTNGMLYGVTYAGGTKNRGSIYSLNLGLGPFVALVQYQGGVGHTTQILGQGLAGATSVTFNGVPATSFTVVEDTYMTAVVPAGATNGPLVVTTPTQTLTSNKNFRISN